MLCYSDETLANTVCPLKNAYRHYNNCLENTQTPVIRSVLETGNHGIMLMDMLPAQKFEHFSPSLLYANIITKQNKQWRKLPYKFSGCIACICLLASQMACSMLTNRTANVRHK